MRVVELKDKMDKLAELQSLQRDLKRNIEDFKKTETRNNNTIYALGGTTIAGWSLNNGTGSLCINGSINTSLDNTETTSYVTVYLGAEVAKLVKSRLLVILEQELEKVEKDINALEV